MDMPEASREEIIRSYNLLVGRIDEDASNDETRAYGGVVRTAKGKLVEAMAQYIIQWAWAEAGGTLDRLSFNDVRRYPVPIQQKYIETLDASVRKHIESNVRNYKYDSQVDVHVFVDGRFAMGVECKSYTENAMLKRILVDYRLLISLHPNLICTLLQLESQLGGDYSQLSAAEPLGSASTHTLMSYFPEIDLEIVTLLEGERKIDRPIHKHEFYKELTPENLERAITHFSRLLMALV